MSVLLSLLAALSYGLADFVGGVFSKRVSPWAVAFSAQVGGAALVLTFSLLVPETPTRVDLAWGVLAGLGNGFGTAFLYRGLSTGRMGVVAPISGVGAALVPVSVGLVAGERPSELVWLGIAIALPGIWFVSSSPSDSPSDRPGGTTTPATSGLGDGILAGLGFGTLFAALAQLPAEAGFLPLALNQIVAGVVIIGIACALRSAWLPREPQALAGLISGALGALATGAFLVATYDGDLTVTAVISSLYPAFTVVLAASVLRERIHRPQAVGLALCALAIGLVAAG